jgi:polyhydroxyalkanoate synthase
LIWSFWVNNNLLGRQPPALDVLFWDNDPTRVPARLHSDLIDIFLNDVFRNPGAQRVFGVPVDYRRVQLPTYYVAGLEDYLMPWRGIFHAAGEIGRSNRFVLSTKGHVQTLLRPPNLAGTEYFVNDNLGGNPDTWLLEAERRAGTWWKDWHAWLQERSGPLRDASPALGGAGFPPLEAAPGSYVRERMAEARPIRC